MNEVIMIMVSMVIAMLLGAVFMLLIGGSTTLKYLRIKTSRGRKVFLFLKTPFGWTPKIATKKEDTLFWKHDKKKFITSIEDEGSLTRYARVDCAFTNLKTPTVAMKIKEGALYPDDFDQQVFNNLLVRAATKPTATGVGDLEKKVMVALVLIVVVGLGVMLIYGKLGAIQKAIELLNVVAPPVV